MIQPYKPRYPSKPTYGQNIHFTNPDVDNSALPKLFLLVSEGNIEEAITYAETSNLSFNALDETGNSLLHIVITSSLSKYDKLRIIKQLINNGVYINHPNKFGVVPLHLASQRHYRDIIEFLLSKKVNINTLDSKQKNALHYACMMKQIACPLKSITEKPLYGTYKPSKNSELYTEVAKSLYDFMIKDPNILRYLRHIYNNFNELYLFEDIKKDLDRDLLVNKERLLQQRNPDNITKIILEKASSTSSSILQRVKIAVDELEFSPDATGWGPDSNTKIMAIISEEQLLKSISERLTNTLKELNDKNTTYIGNVTADIIELDSIRRIFFEQFYVGIPTPVPIPLTDRDYLIFPGIVVIYGGYVKGITEHPTWDGANNRSNLKNPQLLDTNLVLQIQYQNINAGYIRYNGQIDDLFVILKQQITRLYNNLHTDILNNIYIYIGDIVLTCMEIFISITYLSDELQILKSAFSTIIAKLEEDNINMNFDINKYNGIIKEIIEGYIADNNNLSNFRDFFQRILDNYIDTIPRHGRRIPKPDNIPYGYLFLGEDHAISGYDIQPFIDVFYDIINFSGRDTNIPAINIVINATVIPPPGGAPLIGGSFPPDQNYEYFNRIFYIRNLKNLINRINELKLNDFYLHVKNIFDQLENITQFISDLSGYKFMKTFYNNFKQNYFTDPNTDIFDNLYEVSLKEFPKIPESLLDFNAIIKSNNVHITRKIIFESYILQIYPKNNPIYISSTAMSRDFVNGFLITQPVPLFLGLGGASTLLRYFDPTNLPQSKSNQIDYALNQIISSTTKGKKTIIMKPVITYIDTHLKIIKIALIIYIINSIHNNTPNFQILHTIKDKLKDKLQIDDKDIKLIYIIIGKLVDKIISKYITILINNSLIYYLYKQLQIISLPRTVKLSLQQPFVYDESIIKSVEQIYEDFMIKLTKDTKYDLLEDIEEETKDETKCFKSADGTTCFDYDIESIKLLLKNHVDVNKRDIEGNTPIYYAINILNYELVKQLIERKASVFRTTNIYKYSPFDYIFTKLNNLLVTLDPDLFIDSFNEEINQELDSKTLRKKKLRFSDIIFKWGYYLLEHLLTNRYRSYLLKWTYSDRKTLEKQLGIVPTQNLPYIDDIGNIKVSYNKPYYDLLKQELEEFKNKSDSLKQELDEFPLRKTVLEREIGNIDAKIKENEMKIKEIEENNIEKNRDDIKGRIGTITSTTMPNVVEMYDEIFNKFTDDYILYTKLWGMKLDKKKLDELNIIKHILRYLNSSNLDNESINLEIITKYLEGVKVFINNYSDLSSKVYSVKENYALYYIMQIISHIIRHTILINYIASLSKGVVEYARVSYKEVVRISQILSEIFNRIIISNILLMSDRIVKIILNVYEDDNDEDKTTQIETILENIMKLIFINPHFSIDDKNDIYVYTTKTLIPLYTIYLRTYIIKLKEMFEKIFSSISELNETLKIFDLIKKQKFIEARIK